MSNDPVADFLRKQPLTDAQRADLWDVYTQAGDADDLAARLQAVTVPDTVKAELWDFKETQAPVAAVETDDEGVARTPDFSVQSEGVLDSVVGGLRSINKAGVDLGIGAAKAVGRTAVNLGRYTSELGGRGIARRMFGVEDDAADAAFNWADAALQPTNTAQTIGGVGADIGMAIAPGGVITRGAKAAAQWMPKGLQTLTRATIEGAGAGATAAVQGTDPNLAAGIGGAIPLVGGAAGGARRLMSRGGPNPVVQDAIDYARREGIPVDAATATQNQAVRGLQFLADRSLGGAGVGAYAGHKTEQALTRVGQKLAERAYATPVTKEQAGEAVEAAGKKYLTARYNKANKAYAELRRIEADPASLRPVPSSVPPVPTGAGTAAAAPAAAEATPSFAAALPKGTGDLFGDLLMDAKRNGYAGSPDELRTIFNEYLKDASDLADSLNEGLADAGAGRELFEAIAERGGIGVDSINPGEIKRLWEQSTGIVVQKGTTQAGRLKKARTQPTGGLGGVKHVLRRRGTVVAGTDEVRGAMTLDGMAEALRSDPRFKDIDGPNALIRAMDDALDTVNAGTAGRVSAVDALPGVGLRPGTRWWEKASDDFEFGENAGAAPTRVYHASPHVFDQFDVAKMGTGEGSQVYGPGLYFAESADVAKHYQKQFTDTHGAAQFYEVDLNVDRARLLDWDTTISGQSESARAALRRVLDGRYGAGFLDEWAEAGADVKDLVGNLDDIDERELASLLRAEGVPGIRYLDAQSRAGKEGTRNIVLFSGDDARIASRSSSAAPQAATEQMAMPVDMRPIKEALRPIVAEADRTWSTTRKANSDGLVAMRNIIDGDDFVPASIADQNLSPVKKLAGKASMPQLRDRNQGMAAKVIGELETAIQQAVADAGPAATAARDAGRKATREKYAAAEVVKKLRKEPVQVFNQTKVADDTGIRLLRQVQKIAPKEMPKLGRAYLDDIFTKATVEGGFGRARKSWSEWQSLGAETKKIMFPNPMHRKDLDDFFLLAMKLSENPNPSGSAAVGLIAGQSWAFFTGAGIPIALSSAAMSALLHSPRGVRLLTEGLQTPVSGARAGALAAQLQKLLTSQGLTPTAVDPQAPASRGTR